MAVCLFLKGIKIIDYMKICVRFFVVVVILFASCKANINNLDKSSSDSPTCRLLFPQVECPTIRNSFTLRGVANDDTEVAEVGLLLKYESHDARDSFSIPCTLEKKGGAWAWSAVLNVPDKDGSFPLKDGKYFLEVIAKDKDGKTGRYSYSFIVDNTPPLLFLHSKLFKSKEKNAPLFAYSSSMNLRGVASDDSAISKLDFFAYSNGAWEKISFDNLNENFDINIDDFFANTEGFYRKIYGDNIALGEKTFPFAICASDSAREYESPTSNGNADVGNEADKYYIYEALQESKEEKQALIFPKYTPKDVYHMLAGTFFNTQGKVVDAEKRIEVKRVLNLLKIDKVGDDNVAFKFEVKNDLSAPLSDDEIKKFPTFSLNAMQSPTFEILDFESSKLDLDFLTSKEITKEEASSNIKAKNIRKISDVLTARLTHSDNGIPLENSNNFQFYYCDLLSFLQYYKEKKDVLAPYNKVFARNKKAFDSEAGVKKIENVAIKKEKDSYIAYLPISEDLKKDISYLVFVKGRDEEGNQFVAKTLKKNENGYPVYIFTIEGDESLPSSQPKEKKRMEFLVDDVPNLVSVFPEIKGKIVAEDEKIDEVNLKAYLSYNGGKKQEVPIEIFSDGKWKCANLEEKKEGHYQFSFVRIDDEALENVLHLLSFDYDFLQPTLQELSDVSFEDLKKGKKLKFKYFADIHSIAIGGIIKESNGIKELKIGLKNLANEEVKNFYSQVPKPLLDRTELYSFLEKIDFKREGETILVLKIADVAGRESIYEVPVLVDGSAPQFMNARIGLRDFDSFAKKGALYVGSENVAFSFEVKDAGSGAERLEIYSEKILKENLLCTLTPQNTFRDRSSFEHVLSLKLGKNQLIFSLQDKLGHEAQWKCDVNVLPSSSLTLDLRVKQDAPISQQQKNNEAMVVKGAFEVFAKGVNTYKNKSFDLEFECSKDGKPLDSFTLLRLLPSLASSLKCEAGRVKGLKSNTSVLATEYKFAFKPRLTGEDDGLYVFSLNSDSISKKVSIIVDNKAPDVFITSHPSLLSQNEALCFNSPSLKLTGKVKDLGCAVKAFKLNFNGKDIKVSSLNLWSAILELNEGENKLSIYVEDEMGNKSTLEKTLNFDKKAKTEN